MQIQIQLGGWANMPGCCTVTLSLHAQSVLLQVGLPQSDGWADTRSPQTPPCLPHST